MRSDKQDLHKITIRIYKGDLEQLEYWYPGVNYNKIIRALIRTAINKAKKRFGDERREMEPDPETLLFLTEESTTATNGEADEKN